MTGYALVRNQTSAGELTISLRSVNHRALDLHFHHPGELGVFENATRALLKQHIARGHIEIRMSLARETSIHAGVYNRDLLGRYLAVFRQACEDFHLESRPDLNIFLSMPGVLESARDGQPLENDFEAQLLESLRECIENLNAYREREASELSSCFIMEVISIEEAARKIAAIRTEALPHFSQKLRSRLNELLGDSTISESRLAEEAALLADKSDVEEELTRLTVHAQELRRILEEGGEIGKRLDFLLQEMNRETNTILSKTSGIGDAGLTLTSLGLAIKANIERIREQALNLE
ncbi:MAG: YicC/YloC family endoribonuclease [Bryobacteraceae bacterium]